jgi:hypothetical protein
MMTTQLGLTTTCGSCTVSVFGRNATCQTEYPFTTIEQNGHMVRRNPGICPVNLAFATIKLRSLCECQAKAEDAYGVAVARHLRARLADLREVDTVLELPAGRPRELSARPYNNYGVNLAKGYRLVMRANHSKIPVLETGKVDWAEVTRVMIMRIEDGHV